jgi:hypothetical protein
MGLVRGSYSSTITVVNGLWGNARPLFGQSGGFTVLCGFIIGLFKEHSVSEFLLVLVQGLSEMKIVLASFVGEWQVR